MEKTLLFELTQGKADSITAHENNLWVGTSDGQLYLYNIEVTTSTFTGEKRYNAPRIMKKDVQTKPMKKSVSALQVDAAMKRLFVLYEGIIYVYDMTNLELIKPLKDTKNVSCITLNASSKDELAFVSKKKLKVIKFVRRNVEDYDTLCEITLPSDNVSSIEFNNKVVCVEFSKGQGKQKGYTFYSIPSGEVDETFTQNCKVNNFVQDSLASYTNFLRIVAKDAANAIPWKDTITMSSSCFPFVVGTAGTYVGVYNLYERAIVSSFELKERVRAIAETNNRLFICEKFNVFLFTPFSIEEQINQLIKKLRISEAFSMFERTFDGNKKDKERKLRSMHEDAGFACFFKANFKEAFDHFAEAELEPRDVISYFPDLISTVHPYKPKEIKGDLQAKIKEVLESEGEDPKEHRIALRLKAGKKSLLYYLEQQRQTQRAMLSQVAGSASMAAKFITQLQAIDYALVILHLKEFENFSDLKTLLRDENYCALDECGVLLQKNTVYLAYLHWSKLLYNEALQMLKELSLGQRIEQSQTRPGIKGIREAIDLLCHLEGTYKDLVFNYARWIFEMDDTKGIEIFISKHRKIALPIDEVLKFLSTFPKDLERTYLEFLIYQEKITEEKFFNQLISNYIHTIQKLKYEIYVPFGIKVQAGLEMGLLGEIRAKLIKILEDPTAHYDPNHVLFVLERETTLYEETIILHKRLQNHRASLQLIINNIHDYEWAERYCIENHKDEISKTAEKGEELLDYDKNEVGHQSDWHVRYSQNPLFVTLLEICFKPEGNNSNAKNEEYGLYILRKHAKNINPIEALKVLPNSLKLREVAQFLRQTLQHNFDRNKNNMIGSNVQKLYNIESQSQQAKGLTQHATVTASTECPVCKKLIGTSVFVIFSDCTVTHFKCSGISLKNMDKDMYHPLTGVNMRIFGKDLREIDDEFVLNAKLLQ